MDLEADDFSVVSETFSAEHEVVFADETNIESASAALTGVLSELASMGSPLVVGHGVVKLNTNILYNNPYISLLPLEQT